MRVIEVYGERASWGGYGDVIKFIGRSAAASVHASSVSLYLFQ